jgi:LacI family transcriptional regulator
MVTIQDVARSANVSTATVSRVLNGKATVDPRLAARVRAAVEELGYRPNVLAKGLRTAATTVLGVIVPDIENPFLTAVVRGIEDAAQISGYSVVLCNSDEDVEKEARYVNVLLDQRVCGVILAPASEERSDVGALVERHVPVVAVDRALASRRIDTVMVRNAYGAQQATTALIDAGYQRVAMVSGREMTTTAEERLEGYRAALLRAGRPIDERLIESGGYRLSGGYRAVQHLMALRPAPDALFVANNLMAVGALKALTELELRVPADMGFASFDDLPWNTGEHRPICVVSQPAYEIGKIAAEILLARIAGDETAVRHVLLAPVVRDGTHTVWTSDAVQRWTARRADTGEAVR